MPKKKKMKRWARWFYVLHRDLSLLSDALVRVGDELERLNAK